MGLPQSSFLSDGGANSGYHVHGVRYKLVQGYISRSVLVPTAHFLRIFRLETW